VRKFWLILGPNKKVSQEQTTRDAWATYQTTDHQTTLFVGLVATGAVGAGFDGHVVLKMKGYHLEGKKLRSRWRPFVVAGEEVSWANVTEAKQCDEKYIKRTRKKMMKWDLWILEYSRRFRKGFMYARKFRVLDISYMAEVTQPMALVFKCLGCVRVF